MAANMKAVKLRMKSVQSTMQITKAMELVASSKLRKARERAEQCCPYFQVLRKTLAEIAAGNNDFTSPYTHGNNSEKWCYVVIAGDRGLAGGYNNNLFKLALQEIEKHGTDYAVLPIGKKTVEYFKHRKVQLVTEEFAEAASLSMSDCFDLARMLCELFRKGEFGHICVCYTGFYNVLLQKPSVSSLLPLADFAGEGQEVDPKEIRSLILYEPDSETVFNSIVPEYLGGMLFGTLRESVASELASRRTAMDAATKNAGEMMEQLELFYNRARQASITQEITEIVAGAEEL